MKSVLKYLLTVSVILCFLACIWSPFHVQWIFTGLYAMFVSRYIVGSTLTPKVIGAELPRERNTLQLTNLIGRK